MALFGIIQGGIIPYQRGTSSTPADPQMNIFANFPLGKGQALGGYSHRTLSVHAVHIPMSISFGAAIIGAKQSGSGTMSVSFGLYSLNGSTLSLENSASGALSLGGASNVWMSLATSKTQNISPGQWYYALNVSTAGSSSFSIYQNSAINPANAQPFLIFGRMTASTGVMPGSIATSALDITGTDATRQPLIIIAA